MARVSACYALSMRGQDSIVFRIDRRQPIELDRLTLGMLALGAQYERYVKTAHPKADEHETQLLVNRITEGSIEIELFGALQPVLQGMDNYLIFRNFCQSIGHKLGALSSPNGRMESPTTRELRDITRMVETVAGPDTDTAELVAVQYESESNNRKVAARVVIKGRQAEQVVQNAESQIREITGGEPNRQNGVLMRLYQTNIGDAEPDRASGEKGIIESIGDHPRRLIYASDLAAQRIKGAWAEDGTSPYELGFTVDVDVQMVSGKPRAYRIMNVHDVFPLDETDD